ncbi:sodium bile acid symporter family-domain-containing protein [Scenedesmus sp. NREL 46B-D3]|nr:sodium bile acid symporter family-domain-containing protein [Scenedesmus sp. NREL 46B-D3]
MTPALLQRGLAGPRTHLLLSAGLRPAASSHSQRKCSSYSRAYRQAPQQSNSRLSLACAASAAGAVPGDSSSGNGSSEPVTFSPLEQRIGGFCKFLTTLFPLWVVAAALLGFYHPPLFVWFNDDYVTWSLIFCMLAMGLTLTFEEIVSVFTRSPQLLLLGMVLQYSVLPFIGFLISRHWGLSSSLAIGVALVSCMPGGTASNIVAYIARGDMPLSIMMTTASTVMAVFTTPLLTSLLVGTLVPVDAAAMFLSVLKLVLAPVIVGTAANQLFPRAVQRLRIYTPLLATVAVVMIVGSMISTNVAVVSLSGFSIITAVLTLHSCGFGLGFFISKGLGLSDRVCRTNAIEVGMQSSALAAVLARTHFPHDPMIVAPCVLSACTHATLGSLLAGYWNLTSKDQA